MLQWALIFLVVALVATTAFAAAIRRFVHPPTPSATTISPGSTGWCARTHRWSSG